MQDVVIHNVGVAIKTFPCTVIPVTVVFVTYVRYWVVKGPLTYPHTRSSHRPDRAVSHLSQASISMRSPCPFAQQNNSSLIF